MADAPVLGVAVMPNFCISPSLNRLPTAGRDVGVYKPSGSTIRWPSTMQERKSARLYLLLEINAPHNGDKNPPRTRTGVPAGRAKHICFLMDFEFRLQMSTGLSRSGSEKRVATTDALRFYTERTLHCQ
jgi:hypothetical protein